MEVRFVQADSADYKKIKALYKTAFPKNERAPFGLLKKRAKRGLAKTLAVKDGEKFIGFVYLVCDENLVYLFYFAVAEGERGKGYGSAVLQALQKQYEGKRIFIAREQLDGNAENFQERVHRRNFYLRNGFQDIDRRIQEGEVIYDVMSVGGMVTSGEYDTLMTSWCGERLKRKVNIRLFE